MGTCRKQLKFYKFYYFSDACSLLAAQLAPVEEAEHGEWLEKITEHIQKQSLVSPIVEKDNIELALQVNKRLFNFCLFFFLQNS